MKKESDDEFWPRLLADKTLEKTNVKIDWDRYVDEDEATQGFDTSNLDGGMDFGGMGGLGGMDFGGMNDADLNDADGEGEEEDSDDGEDLPDLEPTKSST